MNCPITNKGGKVGVTNPDYSGKQSNFHLLFNPTYGITEAFCIGVVRKPRLLWLRELEQGYLVFDSDLGLR